MLTLTAQSTAASLPFLAIATYIMWLLGKRFAQDRVSFSARRLLLRAALISTIVCWALVPINIHGIAWLPLPAWLLLLGSLIALGTGHVPPLLAVEMVLLVGIGIGTFCASAKREAARLALEENRSGA